MGDLCALAWVRSNFPPQGGPDILETRREGREVTVVIAEQYETISFSFSTELEAARAFKQLPAPVKLQNPFQIAADDLAALETAMNFGQIPQPAPVKSPDLVLG